MEQEKFTFYQNFAEKTELEQFGTNAMLLYALQIKFGIEDIIEVAATALVDGSNDKKTDIVYIDLDKKEAVIGQGYIASVHKNEAPANKASDLNTSVTWLLNRETADIPERLQAAAAELKRSIRDGEIDKITLWYSHNLNESKNVKDELKTAEMTLKSILSSKYPDLAIEVFSAEVGLETIDAWYRGLTTPILITEEILLENIAGFEIDELKWTSFSTYIPGKVLNELYKKHGTNLFSANVRDYLGSRKADSNINNGIKSSAGDSPENFFVYNNGITALTNSFTHKDNVLKLKGISIVNGAQTTGAVGSLSIIDEKVLVPLRIIKCDDEKIISEIVKFNNSQNKVNAPDFRSNDQTQRRLISEFENLKNVTYSSRRGGAIDIIKRNPNMIPSVTAGQVLAAFHREPDIAYNSKSKIWESDSLYPKFFNDNTSAKNIFLSYTLFRAVEELKFTIMRIEEKTAAQEKILKFLRSRGSIVLLTTAVSTCIEEILDKRVTNLFALHFCDDITIEEGIGRWNPVLSIVSAFSDTLDEGLDDGIKNETKIKAALNQFKQLVAAVKGANSGTFKSFADTICD